MLNLTNRTEFTSNYITNYYNLFLIVKTASPLFNRIARLIQNVSLRATDKKRKKSGI